MAIVQMQRIRVCGLRRQRKHILELLQRRGVVEIDEPDRQEEGFELADMSPQRSSLEKELRLAQEALQLLEIVCKCCEEMENLLKEFADFKHSRSLRDKIIAINTLEEEADALYISSMRKLHTEDNDVLHIIAWSEVYSYMEKCADACEHVADIVESVVMKNS